MKISICIPSYNKKSIIETTIQSVVQNMQGIDPSDCIFELVVIDDCSSDGSREFLQILTLKYSFRLVENNPNKGLVKNWNECINQATGDYLLILHSDDILAPGILRKYVDYIQAHPDCKFIHANALDVLLPFFKAHPRITQQQGVIEKGDPALEKIIFHNNLACSTVMVANECYEKLGQFDENSWVSPDWEMWARIGKYYDIHHLPVTGAFVIINEKNTHTSGIPLNVFRSQQQYYIDKMIAYLSPGKQKKLLGECSVQLDKTLSGLGVQYFKFKRVGLSFQYIFSTGESIPRKFAYLIKGFKSLVGNQIKYAFYPRKDFKDVVDTIKGYP